MDVAAVVAFAFASDFPCSCAFGFEFAFDVAFLAVDFAFEESGLT